MERKVYNKLVRDRVPEVIRGNGGVPAVSVLDDAGFTAALREKLVEEAGELRDAGGEDVLGELADVLEVLHCIAADAGFSVSDIEERRALKRSERGGFEGRVFLEHVDE